MGGAVEVIEGGALGVAQIVQDRSGGGNGGVSAGKALAIQRQHVEVIAQHAIGIVIAEDPVFELRLVRALTHAPKNDDRRVDDTSGAADQERHEQAHHRVPRHGNECGDEQNAAEVDDRWRRKRLQRGCVARDLLFGDQCDDHEHQSRQRRSR